MQKVEKWKKEMPGEEDQERWEGGWLDVEDQRLQFPPAEERRQEVPTREEAEMHPKTEIPGNGEIRG